MQVSKQSAGENKKAARFVSMRKTEISSSRRHISSSGKAPR